MLGGVTVLVVGAGYLRLVSNDAMKVSVIQVGN